MKIVNANHQRPKSQLKSLIRKVDGKTGEQALDVYLSFNLGTDVFGAWLAYDNDKIVGMIACEMVEPHEPKAYIAYNYVKPGHNANPELFGAVEGWAKEKDIHKIIFFTKSPNTYIKKYGFNFVRSVLDKDI